MIDIENASLDIQGLSIDVAISHIQKQIKAKYSNIEQIKRRLENKEIIKETEMKQAFSRIENLLSEIERLNTDIILLMDLKPKDFKA